MAPCWVMTMSDYFGSLYLRFWGPKLEAVAEREVADILGIYEVYAGSKPQRVFDLGAGWGRHMIVFHSKGIEPWGIEKEEVFVRHFRETAPEEIKDHLILGDITQWQVPDDMKGTFDLALSLFSSIGWSDDTKVFQRAYDILKPGGIFIVDTDNRDAYVIKPPSRTWQKVEGGIALDKHRINWKDSILITKREIHANDGNIYTLNRQMRLYSLHEIVAMAQQAGLTFLGAFGDLHMGGWSIRAGRNVVVLKKEG